MVVAGIEVEIIQKDIKNLHLAVYPPDGRVRLAAPLGISPQTLELYIASKIGWIRSQQRKFASIERPSPRQYLYRESHYFLGKRYLLRVIEKDHPYRYPKVLLRSKKYIDLYLIEGATTEQKANLLNEWYRQQLKTILHQLLPKWEAQLGVKANQVKVQAMRTKWGSCNPQTKNIRFNLALAQTPHECIEYVVVHELMHLLERKHNDHFKTLLDTHLPNWKQLKNQLNTVLFSSI
jgi:predicted metal-dependent hydrolase